MLRIAIAVLLVSWLCIDQAFATSYYVDNTVSSSGNGLSWATAWKERTNITGLVPGDTVYFSGGAAGQTYDVAASWAPTSGSEGGGYITYAVGQEAGHNGMVTFNCTSLCTSASAFLNLTVPRWFIVTGEVSGQRHMTFSNFTAGAVTGHVCYTQNETDKHVQLLYLEWVNMRFECRGAYVELAYVYGEMTQSWGTEDYMITHFGEVTGPATQYGLSSIHHSLFKVARASTGGLGMDWIIWSEGADIHDNTIIAVDTPSYSGIQHNDGMQFDGSYMRIYNNYFENFLNYPLFHQMFTNISAVRIYNNVINDSGTGGGGAHQCMALGAAAGSLTISNYIVANNTCIGTGTSSGIHFNAGTPMTVGSAVYLVNNLVYDTVAGQTVLVGAGSPTVSNNVGGTANIAFVNNSPYPTNDFHLTSAATAAIDQGITPAPSYLTSVFTVDADNNGRTQIWDVGPYEYGSAPPATAPLRNTVPRFRRAAVEEPSEPSNYLQLVHW